MRTVGKALRILDLFSERTPLLGLSDIARTTGLDRATCHRMLKVLGQHGFVSQSPDTKKYSLGATVLRLARAREAISPVSAALQAIVNALTQRTTETSHASLIAGHQLATVAVCEGLRSNRVHVEHGGRVEPHATASGLACLAFGDTGFVRSVLEGELPAFTPSTLSDADALAREMATIRARGFSVADRSFDQDVVGIAAPIFGADGKAIGAIAVATPASRMDDETRMATGRAVMEAALEATGNQAGRAPADFLDRYGKLQGNARGAPIAAE
jgi:DNA-binding IclR family transcriptional regulator